MIASIPPVASGAGREAILRGGLGGLMKTNVYIDGFNLYYGCVKGTPYRWLNLAQFCQVLLPTDCIHHIRYFTALVQSRPGHPQQQVHQQVYLRALHTIPNLTIHRGQFRSHVVRLPLAQPPASGPRTVEVVKTEEKGSDVNLAVSLLRDGYRRDFDLAVIISNDSDLVEVVRLVRKELGLPVGILNPHPRCKRSIVLSQAAKFVREVDEQALQTSQFPSMLHDSNGTITKPHGW